MADTDHAHGIVRMEQFPDRLCQHAHGAGGGFLNENIATVSDGSVTGKAGGTVTITATLGEETATCTVTVSGAPWVSNEVLKLNKTDFTLRAGDPDVPLKISGNYSSVVWASSNPNVATVSEDGVVKRVGPGRADITATADGHVLTCIVRVK